MPLQIPSEMYLAKLRWRLVGDREEMISTIGLRNNEPGERDITQVAHAVYDAWAGAFAPNFLGSDWSFVGVDVQQGSGDSDHISGSWDEVTNGTHPSGTLPQNCAMLVKKKTALGERWNSGRMFVPPGYLPDGTVSNTGLIDNTQYPALQSFLTEFYDSLRDSTIIVGQENTSFQPVLFHNNPAHPPTDITSLTLDPVVATQRQRLRR